MINHYHFPVKNILKKITIKRKTSVSNSKIFCTLNSFFIIFGISSLSFQIETNKKHLKFFILFVFKIFNLKKNVNN